MIFHPPFQLLESALLQLHHHENLLRDIVFAPKSNLYRGPKAKAWIVVWVPQDNHRLCSLAATCPKSLPHQLRSNPLPLPLRNDGHRR